MQLLEIGEIMRVLECCLLQNFSALDFVTEQKSCKECVKAVPCGTKY